MPVTESEAYNQNGGNIPKSWLTVVRIFNALIAARKEGK